MVDPTTMTISARMILDIMLDQLKIPRAIYRRRAYSNNTISVTLLFNTSAQSNEACSKQMSITDIHSADDKISEDSAAVEAIRYM